jgi:type IV fimbrial biogenesis protein FimT
VDEAMRRATNQGDCKTGLDADGFSLVELLIVVSILAIVLTLGMPSMRGFFAESRLTNSTNALVSAINIARSEAVKRGPGSRVTIRPKRVSDWSAGWTVFTDTVGGANKDEPPDLDSTATVAYFGPLPVGAAVNAPLGYISFVGSGEARVIDADLAEASAPPGGVIETSLNFTLDGKSRCVHVLASGHTEIFNGGCT